MWRQNARVIVKDGKRPVTGFASLIWLDQLDSCQEDRDLECLPFPFLNSTIRTLFPTIRTLRLMPKGYVALLPNVLCLVANKSRMSGIVSVLSSSLPYV